MRKICAIVVTYNRVLLLKECINSLITNSKEADIFVIDNASSDGTEKEIRPFVDNNRVFYYNTGKNLGGAGGFNFGMKEAYNRGYSYFWLMDDDTIVNETTLIELISAIDLLQGSQIGYLSSIAVWVDGSICKMNYHTPTPNQKFFDENKYLLREGLMPIHEATFVSFLVSREIVRLLGFPIKDYFIWGDDTEYSIRIASRYPSYLVGKSKVLHKMAENKGSMEEILSGTDIKRIERLKISTRNNCCTFRRLGFKKFIGYTKNILKMIISIIGKKCIYRGKKIRSLCLGYIIGLFFNPVIERPE